MQRFQSSRDTYLVENSLGEGGMGVAHLVKSQRTGELLFLKQLRLERAGDWKAVELFEREAKVLAQLNHPGIPNYIDYFPTGERSDYALVQSYIEGKTLQEHIAQKIPVSAQLFASYLQQALEILDYLHSLIPPVVHRDITPKNLIISGTRLCLVDFGCVKVALGPSTSMTTVGTFGYMSPEQLVGQAEPASDIYSLGMSFIALASLTEPSQMPLDKATGRVAADQLLVHLPPHLRALLQDMTRPGVGERLSRAKTALARLKEPAPSLEVKYTTDPKPAAQAQPADKKEKRARRRKVALTILGGLFAVLLLGWLSTFRKETGEIRTLGGWFSGHGSTISAITGTLISDYSLMTSPAYLDQVAYSSTGQIASAANREVILWDASAGSVLHKFSEDSFYSPEWLGFTDDGKTLLVGFDYHVTLYDTATFLDTRIDLATLHHDTFRDSSVRTLDIYAPSQEVMRAAYQKDGTTVIYDLKKREVVCTFTHPDTYSYRSRGVFSGDGKLFAIHIDKQIFVWEVTPSVEPLPEKSAKYKLQAKDEVETIAFSKDGLLLAAIDKNGGTVWDMRSGTTTQDFPTGLSSYSYGRISLTFSPDGKTLAAANEQDIRFYDVASGGNIGRIKGHSEEIQDIAFSPDGKSVATAAWDQLVKLWSVPTLP